MIFHQHQDSVSLFFEVYWNKWRAPLWKWTFFHATLHLLQSDQNWEISNQAVQLRALLYLITLENCSSTRQPKEKCLHTLHCAVTQPNIFCIFQVFISSEFLSHPNLAPQWGELEPLTRMSGRMLKCISLSSVETAWIRLISSLTKPPRRESSLSAR